MKIFRKIRKSREKLLDFDRLKSSNSVTNLSPNTSKGFDNKNQSLKESSSIQDLKISTNSEIIERIREDKLMSYLNVASGGLVNGPSCMAYDEKQNLIAIGSRNGTICIIGSPERHILLHTGNELEITFLLFGQNEGFLLSVSHEEIITVWNLRQKQPFIIESIQFKKDKIKSIIYPEYSQFVFCGTDRGNVHILRVNDLRLCEYTIYWNKALIGTELKQTGAVTQMIIGRDRTNILLICYDSGLLCWWSLDKKDLIDSKFFKDFSYLIEWNDDTLLISTKNGILTKWSIKKEEKITTIRPRGKGRNNSSQLSPIWKASNYIFDENDEIILICGGLEGSNPNGLAAIYEEQTIAITMDHVIDYLMTSIDGFPMVLYLTKNGIIGVNLDIKSNKKTINPIAIPYHNMLAKASITLLKSYSVENIDNKSMMDLIEYIINEKMKQYKNWTINRCSKRDLPILLENANILFICCKDGLVHIWITLPGETFEFQTIDLLKDDVELSKLENKDPNDLIFDQKLMRLYIFSASKRILSFRMMNLTDQNNKIVTESNEQKYSSMAIFYCSNIVSNLTNQVENEISIKTLAFNSKYSLFGITSENTLYLLDSTTMKQITNFQLDNILENKQSNQEDKKNSNSNLNVINSIKSIKFNESIDIKDGTDTLFLFIQTTRNFLRSLNIKYKKSTSKCTISVYGEPLILNDDIMATFLHYIPFEQKTSDSDKNSKQKDKNKDKKKDQLTLFVVGNACIDLYDWINFKFMTSLHVCDSRSRIIFSKLIDFMDEMKVIMTVISNNSINFYDPETLKIIYSFQILPPIIPMTFNTISVDDKGEFSYIISQNVFIRSCCNLKEGMKMLTFMPDIYDPKALTEQSPLSNTNNRNIIWSLVNVIKNNHSFKDYEQYFSNVRALNNEIVIPVQNSEIGTGTIASVLSATTKALNEREQKLKELQNSSEALMDKSSKFNQTAAKLASSNKGIKWLKF